MDLCPGAFGTGSLKFQGISSRQSRLSSLPGPFLRSRSLHTLSSSPERHDLTFVQPSHHSRCHHRATTVSRSSVEFDSIANPTSNVHCTSSPSFSVALNSIASQFQLARIHLSPRHSFCPPFFISVSHSRLTGRTPSIPSLSLHCYNIALTHRFVTPSCIVLGSQKSNKKPTVAPIENRLQPALVL